MFSKQTTYRKTWDVLFFLLPGGPEGDWHTTVYFYTTKGRDSTQRDLDRHEK